MRPSESNFNFLSQLYGGLNLTSNEYVSAATVIAVSAGQDVFDLDSSSEASPNNDGDDRRLQEQYLRSSSSSSSNQELPPHQKRRHLQSRVLFLNEEEKTRPRRVLYANDHFEVHHVVNHPTRRLADSTAADDDEDEDHIQLQFYLMT